MGSQDTVDWDRLDKNKFFIYGAGMFSGVTLTLYPLSVIKTKQMTLPGISGGFQGVKQTASTIMRTEGVPGFYRGFGTVMFGTIPARAVYLTTLEWTKSEVAKGVADLGLTGPAAAGLANFAGGAVASLATQSVTVPIDVISQKQMVHGDETVVARHQHRNGTLPQAGSASAGSASATVGAGAASRAGMGSAAAAAPPPAAAGASATTTSAAIPGGTSTASAAPSSSSSSSPASSASSLEQPARTSSGACTSGRPAPHAQPQRAAAIRRIGSLQMVRLILKEEGVGGLYRGFGVSVATFVPSSAVWWGAYGTYQKLIWALRNHPSGGDSSGGGGSGPHHHQHQPHSTGEVVAVQTVSSVLAGFTSGLVTTPVDLVKTRIQVSYKHDGATPTSREVARQVLREDGVRGFLRGAVPRMLNASLWGTCMVTVYEYLKRVCAKEEGDAQP
ncbi:hypothetical protein PLESTB_001248200 [Pleodorina starrii]|uniref:Mitochondrial carrier protein n=1 Tax=Pleodorina starrii TaxID=330485 RepID=A0A9W6BT74_9CHLO|nr:hypothetical protein PLESTM_000211800 [Pleodorina starrii]GLC57633.1 hypothetical protein PLESTB_001248200 [Pleodorina starrii]